MGWWRGLLRAVVYLIILLMIPLLTAGVWIRQEIFSSEHYVETVADLPADPAIQAEATRIVLMAIEQGVREVEARTGTQIATEGDIQLLYDQNKDQINAQIQETVASPQFNEIWIEGNRQAHTLMKNLLTGKETETVQVADDGSVYIDLFPLYTEIQPLLAAQGITLLDQIEVTPAQLQFQVFSNERLAQAQRAVDLVNTAVIVMAILLPLLIVAYLYLCRDRWRGVFWLAIAGLVGMAFILSGLWIGRSEGANAVPEPTSKEATRVFFDALFQSLRSWTLIGIGIAGVVGLIALIMGWLQQRDARTIGVGPPRR